MTGPAVVLVGPMGAGKSTVASLLAKRWGLDVRDTDDDIVATEGRPVSDIFVTDGEPYFREREVEAVARAVAEHSGVLSLGGGAVLDPRTREVLAGCRVVFLRVGLREAVKRVGVGAPGRPMLMGDVRARVKQLLDERTPVYESVATLSVDTDGRTPAQVVDAIIKEFA